MQKRPSIFIKQWEIYTRIYLLQIYLVFVSGFMLSLITSVLGCFIEQKSSNSQGVAQEVLICRGPQQRVCCCCKIFLYLSWETVSRKKVLQYFDLWTVSADTRGKWVISRGEQSARNKYDGSLSWSTEVSLLCLASYTNATIMKDVWVCQKPAKMFPPQNRQAELKSVWRTTQDSQCEI